MDTIKFVIEQYAEAKYGFSFPVINIYINGRNLIDLVSEIESRDQGRNIEESPRSLYIGFGVSRFERFRNEMLGKKALAKSVLLTCICTFELCSCISGKITFKTRSVVWSHIKNPWLTSKTPNPYMEKAEAERIGWRPVNYSDLGPFVFDRNQYLAALDKVTQEFESQKRLFFPPLPPSQKANGLGLLDLFDPE